MVLQTVSVNQAQLLDTLAIEKIGIPSLVLMENAGRVVAEVIYQRLQKYKKPFVCILCGLGNNGGDGFVVGRYMHNRGIKTATYIIGKRASLKQDALVNYQILKKYKYPVKEIQEINSALKRDILKADIIVDAIFGVGLNRRIHKPLKSIIEFLNTKKKEVIAVDMPSGLDGTTGEVYGVCVKATTTVTFSFAKKGFLKNEGPHYTGRVIVADIGIPQRLIKQI